MKRAAQVLHISLILFSLTGGAFSFLFSVLPFSALKRIGDSLSKDGNFESLTQPLVRNARMPALLVGLALLGIGAALLVWRKKARDYFERALGWLGRHTRLLARESLSMLKDAWRSRPNRLEAILLGALLVVAIILRWALIQRPVEYDEAYTYIEFARHPFKQILLDYGVPNNHIFHTILVRIAYLLFGAGLWQLRLPAFLAGLALVMAMFFLGRNYFGKTAGWIAAGLSAALPDLVYRSVAARGYIIVSLMMVFGLLLSEYIRKKKKKAAWFLLAFACAIGFFTIPVMLYPCGFIFIWLLFLGLTRQFGPEYKGIGQWLKYLFTSGFLVIGLTGLLYSSIILNGTILKSVSDNRIFQPYPWEPFLASLPGLLRDIQASWRQFVPPVLWWSGIFCLLVFLIPRKGDFRRQSAMLVVFAIYLSAMVVILRPYPNVRVWIWVLPLLIWWSAAGASRIIEGIAGLARAPVLSPVLAGIVAALILVSGSMGIHTAIKTGAFVEDPDVVPVARFLKTRLSPDDLLVASGCSGPRYWYTLALEGIPDQVMRNRDRPFANVYVITYTFLQASCSGETVESVLQAYGPDSVFLDMQKVDLVFQENNVKVYQVGTFPEKIQKAFSETP